MSAYNTIPLAPARAVTPPPGFRHAPQFDPFEAYMGPFFERDAGGGVREFAFLIDDRHVNVAGFVHGGMLMTFADAALGYAIWDATNFADCVTMSQQTQFVGPARVGELVTCLPKVQKLTRELVFIRGELLANGQLAASAHAVWKLFPKS